MSEPYKRCCLCERVVPLRSMCTDDTETPIEYADAHCANDPNCNIIRTLRYELNGVEMHRQLEKREHDHTVSDLKACRAEYEAARDVMFNAVFNRHFESCDCPVCNFLRRSIPRAVRPKPPG